MPQTSFAQPMKPTAVHITDALRDALGQVLAQERAQWRRERELIEAQARADVLEIRASVERMVAERLASLRDGRDGTDGAPGRDGVDGANGRDGLDGAPGRDGLDGAPGKDGVDGRDGLDGAPGRDGLDGAPGRDGIDGAPGRDGIDGRDGANATDEQVAEAVARYMAANPVPAGRDGRDGVDGRDGAPGAPGAPGKLPVVREWHDAVHYEGDVVTHAGATYQAQRDTGREPPHADWICLAAAGGPGQDGRSMVVRGTWSADERYERLDVVALNGASFAARRDDPGPCPGEGWQMIAAQGGRGKPGDPGRRGDPGPAAAAVVRADVDDDARLTLVNGDGTRVVVDLYPLLSRIDHARGR